MRLRLRDHTVELEPGAPLVMGIVNIGNDSVADNLHLSTLDRQVAFARRQHAAGAHIIDVGVQSGRTDTEVIGEDDEIGRLTPLIQALSGQGIVVSVDTWRAGVVQAVLEAGAAMINDVSGLADTRVAEIAARFGAGLVLMHTRAEPKVEHFPGYEDPMGDVLRYLEEKIARARMHGVHRDRIVVDPGLDYAKTPQESIEVLRRLVELRRLDRPVLLAVSRKYFVGMVTGSPPEQRLAGTLAALDFGIDAGAHIVRVHDVAEVVQFLTLQRALRATERPELLGDPDDEGLKWLAPKGAAAS